MPEQLAFNIDCMEYMRSLPDKAFDLAVVDPPYGAGGMKTGHCGGKGNWSDKYIYSQPVNVEREREREQTNRGITVSVDGSTDTKVYRTGGTWATKFGKKS